MILKASQRGNAGQLAAHLLNDRENDHVTVHSVRGFVASDLHGCFREIEAIAKGTKCRQPLFSLSFNPPQDGSASVADFESAFEQAEERLGLNGQPRAVVFHEKNGRRHAHVVWSRIDADKMTAINLPHFKLKLKALSKQLYLDHDWELPQGHQHLGGASPDNFTLAQWQQAQRLGLDPREIKAAFRDAWAQSDDCKSFAAALASKGYQLARGDRRGFVAVDIYSTVYSVPRWLGVKTKEVKAKLGTPEALLNVDDAIKKLTSRVSERLLQFLAQAEARQEAELAPLQAGKRSLTRDQRKERETLTAVHADRQYWENCNRQARFNRGFRGLWDRLTGKTAQLKKDNELDLWRCQKRDAAEREALFQRQQSARRELEKQFTTIKAKHAHERKRLRAMVADYLQSHSPQQSPTQQMHLEP